MSTLEKLISTSVKLHKASYDLWNFTQLFESNMSESYVHIYR